MQTNVVFPRYLVTWLYTRVGTKEATELKDCFFSQDFFLILKIMAELSFAEQCSEQ